MPSLTGIYCVIDNAPVIANGLGLENSGAKTTMEYTVKLYSLTEHQLQLSLMLSTEVGRGVQIEQVSQGKKSKVP